MIAPVLGVGLLLLAGPFQHEAYLPVDYLTIAQGLERAGETRCVVGADLTMLWVTALTRTCDAQNDSSKVPALLTSISSSASTEDAVKDFPQPDDLVVWGKSESEYGPAPLFLRIVARSGRTVLLSS
jgi:hypothetical protein